MGERTGISWATDTWNPWYGCRRVSPGCDHCYADREMSRFGMNFDVVQRSRTRFYDPLAWPPTDPPRRIFTCSWSDFFIHDADPWRLEAWRIIEQTPWHRYLILTKRPGLMVAWAEAHGWPDHVWAGVSVESAKYLPRLDVLARVPAKVHFVSCEPLLGPLDVTPWLNGPVRTDGLWLDWVIVGGESGPQFRPMNMRWARDIRDDCDKAGVPFWFKQMSSLRPEMIGPPDLMVRQLPQEAFR